MLDLGVRRPFLHYDDHEVLCFLLYAMQWRDFSPASFASKNVQIGYDRHPARPKRIPTTPAKVLSMHTAATAHSFPPLPCLSPECMASRSAARASSIMRSNRRRMAASVNGPELLRSAFASTSFSRSGWYSGIFASCLSLPISSAHWDRSFKSSTNFLSISSMRRRQSFKFMAPHRPLFFCLSFRAKGRSFLSARSRGISTLALALAQASTGSRSWRNLATRQAVASSFFEQSNAFGKRGGSCIHGLRLFDFGNERRAHH